MHISGTSQTLVNLFMRYVPYRLMILATLSSANPVIALNPVANASTEELLEQITSQAPQLVQIIQGTQPPTVVVESLTAWLQSQLTGIENIGDEETLLQWLSTFLPAELATRDSEHDQPE